jgi:hypothetical protein
VRRISCATALLAATAFAWSCTGGQSGTETPDTMAGHGGMPMIAMAGSGEGGRETAGSGGSGMNSRGPAGTMGSDILSQGGGTGGISGGTKLGGTGGSDQGSFAPHSSDGGEGGGDDACACGLAGRAALLRGRLIALDACEVRAQVEEVLSGPDEFTAKVAVGDEIVAHRSQSCGDGPSLAVGDSALIVYAPPRTSTETAEALLASWSDPLVFGTAITLPRGDQDKLLEPKSCASGFGPDAKGTPATAPCR